MWQLELLSRVVPAFGALAKKEFVDSEHRDARLRRDAQECYADLVTIGLGLHISGGEWASGYIDEDVNRLLAALDTRIPPKWSFPINLPIVGQQKVCALRAIFGSYRSPDSNIHSLRRSVQAGGSNSVN